MSSSSSSSSSASSHQWKHDVFVSFRGKDVRKNFISHLFRGMNLAGIEYFSDEDREDTGKDISDKLLKAIHHAKFALLVFSPNYADSKWCMNELVEILKCNGLHKNHGHVVVVIFLGVDANDVSKLTSGSEFAQGFDRLCRKESDDEQKQIWRDALTRAKHLSGYHWENHANGNEAKLIEIIIEYLVEEIRRTRSPYYVKDAIGAAHLANDVIPLLRKGGEDDVRMIGICGTEGIGKTTVAGVACDGIRDAFEAFVSLEKIGEANRSHLLGLQKKLLQNLMKVKGLKMYDDIPTNINEIKTSMRRKKILLVLEDVTKKEQMDYFGAEERETFHPGSRILITTRDPNLLNVLKVDDKHVVKGLSPDEALQFFCHHAFKIKREKPQEGYEELSKSLVHYAGGHPLTLKKLGFYLSNVSKDQWHTLLDKLARSPYLDCIEEVYGSPSLSLQYPVAYGGQGGGAYDDGTYTGVRQINVLIVSSVIASITTDYDQDGCLVRSFRHGGNPDGDIFTVRLNYPDEYLTSISGHIRNYQSPIIIQSLKFHTNRKPYGYGPFGIEKGQPFHIPDKGRRIIGFHGRCGSKLDSIGVHYGPISHGYPFEAFGPCGGDKGEDIWDDGRYTDVREILVGFNSAINFISIIYDKNGCPVGPFTHGESGGGKTYRIKLDNPSECLTSISGYIGEVSGFTFLQSLTVHTNVKCYMPFGSTEGRYFSFPYTGGKIIGFHGRCDGPRLQSIGAYYEPIPHTYPIKVLGPFGGRGGGSWDDGQHMHISKIVIQHGSVIDSIAFDYIDANGSIRSTRHGGKGGGNTSEVKLVLPDEYITSFSGYINSYRSFTVIKSLTFRTNKRLWGPIGKEEGKYFSLPPEVGKIVGFFGRSGTLLDSIGAHIELYSNKLYPFKSVGLFGGSGGSSWDDGNHHASVRKIVIVFEPSRDPIIESITFQYEEEDKNLWLSERHGGTAKGEIHVIDLCDSNEYLTAISGYIRSSSSCPTVIRSLTFQSNKRTIGPFGDEKGVYFSSPTTGGKITGFYGRSGDHLDAIGPYFEPISHLYPIKSIGPFGGLGGNAWDDGKFSGVKEVRILHDDVIHRIFVWYDQNGEPVGPRAHGADPRNGKAKVKTVRLDYPQEYLTSISGYKRENRKPIIVQSLTFHSNKRSYGPFGKEVGRYFGYPSTGSKIIGFYGRSGAKIDSIGVYAEPISDLPPFKLVRSIGGQGGAPWDDGVHTDVRGIEIVVGSVIDSIRVEYDYNGSSIQCSQHGGGDHGQRHEVKLDYPKERLISISGHIRESGPDPPTVIQSLKIHTTRCTYGPFGEEKGKEFCIPSDASGGRIIGFYGRSESHLDSIGARLEQYK